MRRTEHRDFTRREMIQPAIARRRYGSFLECRRARSRDDHTGSAEFRTAFPRISDLRYAKMGFLRFSPPLRCALAADRDFCAKPSRQDFNTFSLPSFASSSLFKTFGHWLRRKAMLIHILFSGARSAFSRTCRRQAYSILKSRRCQPSHAAIAVQDTAFSQLTDIRR